MARTLRPAQASDPVAVREAYAHLQAACALLAAADAPQALAKARSAKKSTEGALRHVKRRVLATYSQDD